MTIKDVSNIWLLLLLLLLLLLSELLSPRVLPINASLQAWGYFNQGSQLAFRHMLPDWAHVQRSTVGRRE